MANQEHLDKIKEGVDAWNQWRQVNPDIQPDLSKADLSGMHLEGANLSGTHLEGANLREVFFDGTTLLNDIESLDHVYLVDGHWNGVNLAVVNWSLLVRLGEEDDALLEKWSDGSSNERLREYQKAIRANQQLAVALRGQGLNEEAGRFAYQAKVFQRGLILQQIPRQQKRRDNYVIATLPFFMIIVVIALVGVFEAKSQEIQRHICHPNPPFDGHVLVCQSPLAVSPTLLLVAGLMLVGGVSLVFLPVVYLMQEYQQKVPGWQILLSQLLLLVGLMMLILPPLIFLPPLLLSLLGFQWSIQTLFGLPDGIQLLLLLVIIYFLQRAAKRVDVLKKYNQSILQTISNYGNYALSLFLDVLSGYGFKPDRTLRWYVATIIIFAIAYFSLGTIIGSSVSWNEALVFSLSSFHGRGFFPGDKSLIANNPLIVLAAIEAVVGLIIEITFITTFTQRFFEK